METVIYNLQGKESGKIELPKKFETEVSGPLLHEVIVGLQANKRAGTHSTKTRGEVSGGGCKPWKQKGTGNARSGSTRSPLWRKGGIIFGPRPHGYYQNLTARKRQLALAMALSQKATSGALVVVDSFAIDAPKTKKVVDALKKLNSSEQKVVIVLEKMNKAVKTASRNIQNLVITDSNSLNAYEALWAKKLIVEAGALSKIGASAKEK